MAITEANVYIGSLPNDGSGDPLRVAFDKINNNFANLMLLAPNGPEGSFQFANSGLYNGTANLVYDSANNKILIGSTLIPTAEIDIGSSANKFSNIYLNNTLNVGNSSITEAGGVVSINVSGSPATISVNDINATGNLNLTGDLVLGNISLNSFEITTTTSTANQIVFQTPTTTFNSAEFKITSREGSSNNSQYATIKITRSNNNNDVNYCVYGTVFYGLAVTQYNVIQAFGNIKVMVSPFRNSTTVHTIEYTIID